MEPIIDFNEPVKIDLNKFLDVFPVFKTTIWVKCQTPITRKDIELCLKNNELQGPNVKVKEEFGWDISSKKIHTKRIAWLVKNFDDNKYPISIDFGFPNHCCITIDDGNHRLLAAYYQNKPFIKANCAGAISTIIKYLYNETEKDTNK